MKKKLHKRGQSLGAPRYDLAGSTCLAYVRSWIPPLACKREKEKLGKNEKRREGQKEGSFTTSHTRRLEVEFWKM